MKDSDNMKFNLNRTTLVSRNNFSAALRTIRPVKAMKLGSARICIQACKFRYLHPEPGHFVFMSGIHLPDIHGFLWNTRSDGPK